MNYTNYQKFSCSDANDEAGNKILLWTCPICPCNGIHENFFELGNMFALLSVPKAVVSSLFMIMNM